MTIDFFLEKYYRIGASFIDIYFFSLISSTLGDGTFSQKRKQCDLLLIQYMIVPITNNPTDHNIVLQ